MTPSAAPRHMSPDVTVTVDVDLATATATAWVRGKVDYTTVGVVRDRLLELARSPVRMLALDLSYADLEDPTGPAALLHVHDVCHARGVRCSFVVPPGSPAESTLRSCGLLELFLIER